MTSTNKTSDSMLCIFFLFVVWLEGKGVPPPPAGSTFLGAYFLKEVFFPRGEISFKFVLVKGGREIITFFGGGDFVEKTLFFPCEG